MASSHSNNITMMLVLKAYNIGLRIGDGKEHRYIINIVGRLN